MNKDDVECRELTPAFPNLVATDGEIICTMEVDSTTLIKEGRYTDEEVENLIQKIAAQWVQHYEYDGRGTIWQWGSPSVNFQHQGYSIFFAFLGMPELFRKYINTEMKVLKECVRADSDWTVPDPAGGWGVMCHIEDQKVWNPLDSSLWQEVKLTEEFEINEEKMAQYDDTVVYQQSKMDTVYYDGDVAAEGDACEVKIGNGEIVVSYEEGGGFAVYKGEEVSEGHFILEYPENKGKASLHRFANSNTLEGFWVEGGAKGFWRIYLEK